MTLIVSLDLQGFFALPMLLDNLDNLHVRKIAFFPQFMMLGQFLTFSDSDKINHNHYVLVFDYFSLDDSKWSANEPRRRFGFRQIVLGRMVSILGNTSLINQLVDYSNSKIIDYHV
jgi:hypothetical protein